MPGSQSASLVTTPAAVSAPPSQRQRIKQVLGYGYAVVLPWLAAYLSFHMPAMRGMRLALNFSAIAVAETFFGAGPAVVALAVSVVSFEHYLPSGISPGTAWLDMPVRVGVIVLAGTLISLMIRRRRRAEGNLRAALATLQEQAAALIQAQQASRSAAWTFFVPTRQTKWYEGGAEIFGRPHKEITALGSPTSLVLEEDLPLIAAAARLTETTGAPFHVEFRVRWPNGEVHTLEARGVPLASDPMVWRGATIDVTERKQAEAALIRTEKLAVAGRLAASIAHEINNPLEAVTNLCYLAKLTAANEESKTYIEMAEGELGRMAHITSQTLRFHRQQTAAVETDLADMVQAILTLYENKLIRAGIAVGFENEGAPALVCYAGEMRQVLANLIANAIDAMPNGGRLRARVRRSTDWRSGMAAVRVTVADTGHGMSPETLKRMYEPFYTTKGDMGTGLGLWVTAGIVEKHHGTLRVRSSRRVAGGGSAFGLVLPYPMGTAGAEALVAELKVEAGLR
jgi:PAS domain S-box-containing protein